MTLNEWKKRQNPGTAAGAAKARAKKRAKSSGRGTRRPAAKLARHIQSDKKLAAVVRIHDAKLKVVDRRLDAHDRGFKSLRSGLATARKQLGLKGSTKEEKKAEKAIEEAYDPNLARARAQGGARNNPHTKASRKRAGRKAAATRKRNHAKHVAAGKKGARKRAGKRANPHTKKSRKTAGRKAAATRKRNHAIRVKAGKKAARTRARKGHKRSAKRGRRSSKKK